MSSFSVLQQSSYKQKNIYICSQTHTRTHKNQLLPKSLLYVGSVYVFLGVCVCMCVGSAVPPGCPETNWQLEKLWLQGKVSKARDGDKEDSAGEGERQKGKKGTRHNNIHKGRADSAKCGQQSLYLCDADSPLFIPTFQGGKPRRRRESLHSDTHLSPRSFFFPSSHPFSKQHLRGEQFFS